MANVDEKIIDELKNTKDTTEEFEASDIEGNKVLALFAYLSWLVLIPILGAKNSKFARFHANQGLVLAIAEIIAFFILGILRKLPLIGWVFGLFGGLLELVCLAMAIIGIANALNGKAKELPFVGKFKILQ